MTDPYAQLRNLPLLATPETCSGRTYIVTGANTGLGLEAAKHLVALGSAKVILAVRNLASGDEAKAKIEASTGITTVAEVWRLDLADYASIKSFCDKALATLPRLDGLICNASIASQSGELINGHNPNVAVNVLGTFLAAVLLFPKLSQTAQDQSPTAAPSHLAFVCSRAGFEDHAAQPWNAIKDDPLVHLQNAAAAVDNKPGDENGVPLTASAYPLSKLIETLSARHLATLLPVDKTRVVITSVCPGVCITDLDRSAPPEFRSHLAEIRERIGRTAEDGSRTLLHAAVAGEEAHGVFLHSCGVGE